MPRASPLLAVLAGCAALAEPSPRQESPPLRAKSESGEAAGLRMRFSSIGFGILPRPTCGDRAEVYSPSQFTEDAIPAWFGADRWFEIAADPIRDLKLAVEVSGTALDTGDVGRRLGMLLKNPGALLAEGRASYDHEGHPFARMLGVDVRWEFPDPSTTLSSLASGLLDVWTAGISEDELTQALWLGAQGVALAMGPTRLGLVALELTAAERWVLWLSQLTFALASARLGQAAEAPPPGYAPAFASFVARHVFPDGTVPQALALRRTTPGSDTDQIVQELLATASPDGRLPTRLPPPLVVARSPGSIDQLYLPNPTVVDMSASATVLVLNGGPNEIVVSTAPGSTGTRIGGWSASALHWDGAKGAGLYVHVAGSPKHGQRIDFNPRVGAQPTSPWPDLAPSGDVEEEPACDSHRFRLGDRDDLVNDLASFGAELVRTHAEGSRTWSVHEWHDAAATTIGMNRGAYRLSIDQIGGDANVEKLIDDIERRLIEELDDDHVSGASDFALAVHTGLLDNTLERGSSLFASEAFQNEISRANGLVVVVETVYLDTLPSIRIANAAPRTIPESYYVGSKPVLALLLNCGPGAVSARRLDIAFHKSKARTDADTQSLASHLDFPFHRYVAGLHPAASQLGFATRALFFPKAAANESVRHIQVTPFRGNAPDHTATISLYTNPSQNVRSLLPGR